jgi:hypothetical protein
MGMASECPRNHRWQVEMLSRYAYRRTGASDLVGGVEMPGESQPPPVWTSHTTPLAHYGTCEARKQSRRGDPPRRLCCLHMRREAPGGHLKPIAGDLNRLLSHRRLPCECGLGRDMMGLHCLKLYQ